HRHRAPAGTSYRHAVAGSPGTPRNAPEAVRRLTLSPGVFSPCGRASRPGPRIPLADFPLNFPVPSPDETFKGRSMEQFHATTIICVRRGNDVALGGDGQVTLGNIVIKGTARKIRRLYQDKILAGFA